MTDSTRLVRRIVPLLLALALAGPGSARAADPTAEEVLGNYLKAIGGEEALRGNESRHFTGTMSLPAQGIEGKLEVFAAAPNLYLLTVTIPGIGDIRSGFDGETGWMMQPMSGPMLLEGKALEQLKEEADYFELLKAKDRYTELVNEGLATIQDRSCWKLKLVRKSGRTSREYYDAATWLPVAAEGPQETPMGTIEVLTVFDEHKEFGGVMYPSVLRQSMMGMEQVMRLEAAEFGKVDRSVFALPPEIVALKNAPAAPKPEETPKPGPTPEPGDKKGGW